MKKTLRTFVAVEIDRAIRAQTAALVELLSAVAAEVKWVEPHNFHLTMKFLGEVRQDDIASVCQAVQAGAAQVKPFELELCGAGAFPHIARPRTVWLGVHDGTSEMIALHDCIEAELAQLGFREEHRQFQPHLTIGRARGGGPGLAELGDLLRAHADFQAGRMQVRKATVFASTLTPAGPIYEAIGSALLGR